MRWIWPRPAPPVALAAVRKLDDEAREEASARAQLTHWKVLAAGLQFELRQRNRAYGQASETIGRLRADLARVRELLREQPIGYALPAPWHDLFESSTSGDAQVVEEAERYGDELTSEVRDPYADSWAEVEQLARVLNEGDQKLDGLPAWDELATTGRHDYLRLAQFVVRAGWRAPGLAAAGAEQTSVGAPTRGVL